MAIKINLKNTAIFITSVSPIIISIFFIIDSFLHMNINGLVWLVGIFISQLIAHLLRGSVINTMPDMMHPWIIEKRPAKPEELPAHDLCEIFEPMYESTRATNMNLTIDSIELANFLGYNANRFPDNGDVSIQNNWVILSQSSYLKYSLADSFIVEMLNLSLDSYDTSQNQRKNILATIPQSDDDEQVLYNEPYPIFINLRNNKKIMLVAHVSIQTGTYLKQNLIVRIQNGCDYILVHDCQRPYLQVSNSTYSLLSRKQQFYGCSVHLSSSDFHVTVQILVSSLLENVDCFFNDPEPGSLHQRFENFLRT